MRKGFRIPLIGAVAVLCACTTTTQQFADRQFRPPAGDYRLIVMQPDISVGVLMAGGGVEPNEDWTKRARQNVIKALVTQQAKRGAKTHVAATHEDTGAEAVLSMDLMRLHAVVGESIRVHKYLGQPLPTKAGKFDWTLGEPAVEFGATTQYDYALFLHAQDTFASSGRVALQVVGALACITTACQIPPGGQQTAFASLVDLKTGQIVWFNVLSSTSGDIRTPEGARVIVNQLLGNMKPGVSAYARPRARQPVRALQ